MVFIYKLYIDNPKYTIPGKSEPKEKARKWLLELCSDFVQTYLLEGKTVLPIINRVKELHESLKKGYVCRHQECNYKYVHHSGRVR
jgi:hypothetical protein